ncbi:hypothetical protein P421_15515 [Heyndrickxia coagulans P38]|nr:hypothetical protein P421_15515 [Heyndrickxia coagulans P38]
MEGDPATAFALLPAFHSNGSKGNITCYLPQIVAGTCPPAEAKATCFYKSSRGKRNAQNSLNKTHITKAHTGMDKPMPIRQPFAKSPSFPFISSFSFLSNRMHSPRWRIG